MGRKQKKIRLAKAKTTTKLSKFSRIHKIEGFVRACVRACVQVKHIFMANLLPTQTIWFKYKLYSARIHGIDYWKQMGINKKMPRIVVLVEFACKWFIYCSHIHFDLSHAIILCNTYLFVQFFSLYFCRASSRFSFSWQIVTRSIDIFNWF